MLWTWGRLLWILLKPITGDNMKFTVILGVISKWDRRRKKDHRKDKYKYFFNTRYIYVNFTNPNLHKLLYVFLTII